MTDTKNSEDEKSEAASVSTVQRIYQDHGDEDIIIRDKDKRRSFINRAAYAKLHRTSNSTKRHSVDNLKGKFESLSLQSPPETQKEKNTEVANDQPDSPIEKFSPASFGYPKSAKLSAPLVKPKPVQRLKKPKDENSNLVDNRASVVSDVEEINVILQPAASKDSIDKIANELEKFTMDEKPKKRGTIKKLFLGGLFGKDKKKKKEEEKKSVCDDNLRNESNFTRSPLRQTVPTNGVKKENIFARQQQLDQASYSSTPPAVVKYEEFHKQAMQDYEQQYGQQHINRFNAIRRSFDERSDNYVIMDVAKKNDIANSVNRFIDTSSSSSGESDKVNGAVARDTPPRAQETCQSVQVVSPKIALSSNVERGIHNPSNNQINQNDERQVNPRNQTENQQIVEKPLPSPKPPISPRPIISPKPTITPRHQLQTFPNQQSQSNDQVDQAPNIPRTLERNLDKSNIKDYPEKPKQEDTYGTVYNNKEYYNGDLKPFNARPPQSPSRLVSLESTKLKLPPNREIYEPQPRVKSPIPTNKVSTEKIIATELLKSTRSPTPPRRIIEPVSKPPPLPKPRNPESDKIVTNAQVHVPKVEDNVSLRSNTPIDLRMSVAMKMSPRKEEVRKSVEEYYWKQLKKMKEEEDSRLYALQMNGYVEDSRLRRSRSLSPHRAGRKSLSLPRGNYVEYGRVPPQQPIPENQALITNGRVNTVSSNRIVYDGLVRNNPERRSVDSLQRPIFRRGSLTKQESYDSPIYNKRVSFSSSQQAWPTRNGYTQNPPQRRPDRMDSELDDEVFIQSPIDNPTYGTRFSVANEPVYTNRVLEQFRTQQYQLPPRRYYDGAQMGDRRMSTDSLSRQQDIYGSRPMMRRPMSQVPQLDDYGRVNQYSSNLSLQRNPIYSSRQSMTDSNYGQKNISVRNKYCDMYGQIHDSPQTGVVMGQLQNHMVLRQPNGFVRGSRLTSSANDLGQRQRAYENERISRNYENERMTRNYENKRMTRNYENERISKNYENRPLPPTPKAQVSDTESGSDASEVYRIMMNGRNKKRGLFGK